MAVFYVLTCLCYIVFVLFCFFEKNEKESDAASV